MSRREKRKKKGFTFVSESDKNNNRWTKVQEEEDKLGQFGSQQFGSENVETQPIKQAPGSSVFTLIGIPVNNSTDDPGVCLDSFYIHFSIVTVFR